MKKLLALLVLLCAAAFAQGEHKIAVYATGSLGANEKEALNTKMLSSFAGNGKYKAIENSEAFFSGLQEYEKTKALENSQIIAFGKQFGAQQVCLINIKPAFDSYHVSARIIDAETQEVVVMGEAGSSLKSFEDLSVLEHRLSSQLLGVPMMAAASATALASPIAAPQQCDKKYNVNEIAAQIQYGFPAQLKDCGSSFTKDLALSKMPFSKTPPPEPKSYMTTCTIDGIKSRLPEGFPGVDKVVGDVQNIINNILNAAMAGASLDPTKLVSAIGDMKVDDLLGGIKNMAAENPSCFVDEPYEYVASVAKASVSNEKSERDSKDSKTSLGFRWGTYFYEPGWQLGLLVDIAATNWFHFQPSVMYMQKTYKTYNNIYSNLETRHNAKILLLFSLKLAALRISSGPDFCVVNNRVCESGSGLNLSSGFDIGKLYTGIFYDFGKSETLGLNVGINF